MILTGGGGMEAMGGYCAVTDEVLFQLSGSDLFRKLASLNSLFVGKVCSRDGWLRLVKLKLCSFF